jgi:succinate dehydrogenase / fumarate reductase cytochrome b subunit
VGDSSGGSFLQRHNFLIRRLHSLSGLVPVGVYLVMHLTFNSTILAGKDAFQASVDQIHLLSRMGLLTAVEITFIFLPLLFHGVVGLWLIREAEPTSARYRFNGNIRYTLQRVTGVIAFVFIFYHIWQMHWFGAPFGGANFDAHNAAESAAAAIQSPTRFHASAYTIGMLASVYHLANGLWTALITWGITIGPRSQRMSGWACTAFGVVLGLVGLGSVVGFARFDTAESAEGTHAVSPLDQTQTVSADGHH